MVLGIHRSGASAVAGVLHHLGVYMGKPNPGAESELPPIDGWPTYSSNPRGQFEDGNFCNINRALVGPNWRNPQLFLDRKGEGFAEAFATNSILTTKPIYGFKDPAACFTWSVWLQVFSEAGHKVKVIIVKRNFSASITSLIKREPVPEQVANHILSQYWINLAEAAEKIVKSHPVYAFSYEALLAKTEEEIKKLAAWCFTGLDVQPTSEQMSTAVSHIDPSLNHA